MSAYGIRRHDRPVRADAFVASGWCSVEVSLLIWHHYTHFEAQRTGRRIVKVDLLCDGFGEVFCAADFGVKAQAKEVGCAGRFAFLRCCGFEDGVGHSSAASDECAAW